jgi:hypothetical protein
MFNRLKQMVCFFKCYKYFFSCIEYISDEFNTANALGKGSWKRLKLVSEYELNEAGVSVPEFSPLRA